MKNTCKPSKLKSTIQSASEVIQVQTQYINFLLDLPEFQVTNIYPDEGNDTVFMEVEPVAYVQPCPYCHTCEAVIRNGIPYKRKVRHLPAFDKKIILLVPAIRLRCNTCEQTFMWIYASIEQGKRFTKALQEKIPRHVIGATVAHAASVLAVSYSTTERVYKQWMEGETARIQQACLREATEKEFLVLGMDDFAIRKGHTYNTGVHDLRGETFLDIIPGRTLEELRAYYQQHPEFFSLEPVAVVMDLAKCYHTFIKEVYPHAIRIADRFHVNRYVTEALQTVRKDVQKTLSPRARKHLKENHRILGKRHDDLTDHERQTLEELLHYSDELRDVYEWKEAFIEWYDCSSSYELAKTGFLRWCENGERLTHPAVKTCLKTMKNWQEEICNYHRLRFTNAAVEGRNNQIKALQRRHYFTRNPRHYKQRILLECNRERVIL
jgi:transposase